MGIKPEYLENLKQGTQQMSDVATANFLVQSISGKSRVCDILFGAAVKLKKLFPHSSDSHNEWTERRLRAWWNGESERVLHWQMMELYEAASVAKEERLLLAEARREHAEFIAKTARLAALLERQDETFHSTQIEALGQPLGRMGVPGNCRD